MSNSNWKKEIEYYTCNQKKVLPINSTFDINALESKMKKGSQFKIILTRSIYGTTAYDVTESKMSGKAVAFNRIKNAIEYNLKLNLEKRNEMNPAKNYLNSNNFSLSTKGVCYR
jgi:hypothetical protein